MRMKKWLPTKEASIVKWILLVSTKEIYREGYGEYTLKHVVMLGYKMDGFSLSSCNHMSVNSVSYSINLYFPSSKSPNWTWIWIAPN